MDTNSKAQVFEAYRRLPLSFEPNHGQTDPQVQFLSRGGGSTLWLASTEAVLSWQSKRGSGQVVRMKLLGANARARARGLDPLPGRSHYFLGNDPDRWHTGIPQFGRVEFSGVYPGVDLIYYGQQRQLEYDLVVAPGADPGAIRLAFEGVRKLRIDRQGDLVLEAAAGDLRQKRPRIYQDIAGARREIAGAYVLHGKQVGFQVVGYDRRRPLVIDPVLAYSTYLGGRGLDEAFGIAVDSVGNTYVAGFTFASIDFPTTPGAFDTTCDAGAFCTADAFVTKLNAAGTALIYSTYLGGSAGDLGFGIAVDSSGNAYITGQTGSLNFPTTPGALDATCGTDGNCNFTGADAFVTKLNAAGSALVYSTYLGGSGPDGGTAIAVNSSGNAYVIGQTVSTDFPTTPGAFDTTCGTDGTCNGGSPNIDAFVTKLNAAGSALVYSTYLGGSRYDFASGIALDSSGNAYVTGLTFSANFPTTPGAFDTTCGVDGFCNAFSFTDAFVTKLNAAGSALVYSTYLGGSAYSISYGIAVDFSGNAYVTGYTSSPNFPTTPGAFDTACGTDGSCDSSHDAFVTKLNAAGSALVYSTYLGGSGGDIGNGIVVDSSGSAYVTGETFSSNFSTTPGAFDTTCGTDGTCNGGIAVDAFVTKLNPAGSALVYSTYLGGSGSDEGARIAVDSSGNIYVIGQTSSSNFPTTPGAFDTTCGTDGTCNGGSPYSRDVFVAKFSFACPPHTVHGHISTVPPSHSGNVSHQHHGQHGHTVANNCPPHAPGHTPGLMPDPEEGLFAAGFSAPEADTVVQRGSTLKLFRSGKGLAEAPQVRVGDSPAVVVFSNWAPNSPGVWEIDVITPESAPAGTVHVAVFHLGSELDSIDIIVQ